MPAYDAGLDQNDTITELDGKPVSNPQHVADILNAHKPGDTIPVAFKRRNGTAVTSKIVLKEDPALEGVLIEDAGGTPTAEQKTFRDNWLGSSQGRR
jgi:PDZ domain-containing secreted protein